MSVKIYIKPGGKVNISGKKVSEGLHIAPASALSDLVLWESMGILDIIKEEPKPIIDSIEEETLKPEELEKQIEAVKEENNNKNKRGKK